MDLSITAFKTLSPRSLISLQEEKLFLSTFVSLFENEPQLEPTWVRFCRFLDCLLIRPASSFYQLQSREAEGVAMGRTWSSATD
jgi:hypothetical protein